VQKRPSSSYRTESAPINLPDDFPVAGGEGMHRQDDAPITRLHLHNCLEIGYCHAGSGIFVIEDKVLPFATGDVTVINDRELHLARSTAGTISEWTWLMIDPLRLLGSVEPDPALIDIAPLSGPAFANVLAGDRHPEITAAVRAIIAELRGRSPGYRSSVRGLIWSLMVHLRRLPGRAAAPPPLRRQADLERIAPALQYLARCYDRPITITHLAALTTMSVTHFRRIFVRVVGRSPLAHVNHLRIQMARSLLASTDRSVLEIALAVGYETLSTFNRNFRATTGMAPREWRRTPG
jgi:AraC-like DNA-binding protein